MRTEQLAAHRARVVVGALLLAGTAAAISAAAPVTAATATRAGPAGPRAPWMVGGDLYGVASASAADAWAVGSTGSDGSTKTLIVHWGGKTWTRVPSPNPGGKGSGDFLNAVAAVSAADAWAVGAGLDTGESVIVHWNGRTWKHVPSPSPDRSGGVPAGNILYGVAVISAGNAWAVGDGFSPSVLSQTLIEHWNGKTWTHVPSPNPEAGCGGCQFPGDALYGVAATSARNAWAVGATGSGRTLIEHWNGKTWTWLRSPRQASADGNLYGVAATSAGNAWAVGATDGVRTRTLIEHWNGKTWKRVPSPSPSLSEYGDTLYGVAATSARYAWAVGEISTGNDASKTMILHWNGKTWRQVPSPGRGNGAQFYGVAATSDRGAWAVGFTFEQTLIAHWNGAAWK